MQVLIFIALLVIGGFLNFITKPGVKFVYIPETIFIILALLLCTGMWLFYFAGIKNEFIIKALSFILEWGRHVWQLLLGYLVGYILFSLKTITTGHSEIKKTISLALWGVAITIGNTFLIATIGKAMNMAEMISFFKISGYAVWFLYFIMVVEPLGGLGVLLHFKLKTGALATIGLMLIMLGAVYTHWHNHDPLSDSYAAISQLITLTLLLILYRLENKADKIHSLSSNQI